VRGRDSWAYPDLVAAPNEMYPTDRHNLRSQQVLLSCERYAAEIDNSQGCLGWYPRRLHFADALLEVGFG
jgi:hypothetical protein